MRKIFVSQPMIGHSKSDVLKVREVTVRAISDIMQGEEFEVIENYIEEDLGDPLLFIAKSLELMADADLVVFAPGWEKSRGCEIEYLSATTYKLPVITINLK